MPKTRLSQKMASKIFSILIFSVVIVLTISSHFTSAENEIEWEAKFDRNVMSMNIGEPDEFLLLLKFLKKSQSEKANTTIRLVSSHPEIVQVLKTIPLSEVSDLWNGFHVEIQPVGLGKANVSVEITRNDTIEMPDNHVEVSVTRSHMIKKFKPQNVLFYLKFMQYFYILMNVCFGAALDVKKLKAILANPIGPSLALISNFVILPLVRAFNTIYTIF